ncbi:hypothetical protein BDZ85DRAFT_264732 [Elsinoe ampelina]|uniref:BTB domain-containing protein n=1 Tax=Elsinoe ampelina TaxID=302913 RepID=A0A6A6G8W0_9PEZI|nr:hypothetical protein BDZ85DRAFT_264732 [Elsinoe ampelina]
MANPQDASSTQPGVAADDKAFEAGTGHFENHAFYKLYQTGIFSDCKIKCGDIVFNGHVCVLASACKWFETALCGSFKEAEEKTVDLSADSWTTVKMLIKFAYGCQVGSLLSEGNYYSDYIPLYSLADRVGYNALKEAAGRFLHAGVTKYSWTQATLRKILRMLDEHSPPNDDTLFRVGKDLAAEHVDLLKRLTPVQFQAFVNEVPFFSAVALSLFTTSPKRRATWKCEACSIFFSLPATCKAPQQCPPCKSDKTAKIQDGQ